jgi:hypothetical protein
MARIMARALPLLAVLVLPGFVLGQGKLDQAREAIDKPSSPGTSSGKSSDDDSLLGALFGGLAGDSGGDGSGWYVLGAAWTLPHDAWDAGSRIDIRYAPFPYADAKTRYVVLDRTPDGKPSYYDLPDTQWWSVRASAEAGSNFDGLDRLGLRLFLDTNTRFGLKSDWDYYSEKQPCGCRDTLWLGDVTATYRFVQNEGILMTTGLGGRFSFDHGHDHGGLNFLYGFDLFPAKPWHLFGDFDGGFVGSAGYARLRGGVGVNCTHVELFAGYDFVRIGGVNLQGPMAGLRLWF